MFQFPDCFPGGIQPDLSLHVQMIVSIAFYYCCCCFQYQAAKGYRDFLLKLLFKIEFWPHSQQNQDGTCKHCKVNGFTPTSVPRPNLDSHPANGMGSHFFRHWRGDSPQIQSYQQSNLPSRSNQSLIMSPTHLHKSFLLTLAEACPLSLGFFPSV